MYISLYLYLVRLSIWLQTTLLTMILLHWQTRRGLWLQTIQDFVKLILAIGGLWNFVLELCPLFIEPGWYPFHWIFFHFDMLALLVLWLGWDFRLERIDWYIILCVMLLWNVLGALPIRWMLVLTIMPTWNNNLIRHISPNCQNNYIFIWT